MILHPNNSISLKKNDKLAGNVFEAEHERRLIDTFVNSYRKKNFCSKIMFKYNLCRVLQNKFNKYPEIYQKIY